MQSVEADSSLFNESAWKTNQFKWLKLHIVTVYIIFNNKTGEILPQDKVCEFVNIQNILAFKI